METEISESSMVNYHTQDLAETSFTVNEMWGKTDVNHPLTASLTLLVMVGGKSTKDQIGAY